MEIKNINRQNPLFCCVVPCFNEQEVLSHSISRLKKILDQLISAQKINKNSFILFVDDGSTDSSWEIIENS